MDQTEDNILQWWRWWWLNGEWWWKLCWLVMKLRRRMPLGIQKLAFSSDSDCEIIKIANLILLLLLLPFTTTTIKIGSTYMLCPFSVLVRRCRPWKMQTRWLLKKSGEVSQHGINLIGQIIRWVLTTKMMMILGLCAILLGGCGTDRYININNTKCGRLWRTD